MGCCGGQEGGNRPRGLRQELLYIDRGFSWMAGIEPMLWIASGHSLNSTAASIYKQSHLEATSILSLLKIVVASSTNNLNVQSVEVRLVGLERPTCRFVDMLINSTLDFLPVPEHVLDEYARGSRSCRSCGRRSMRCSYWSVTRLVVSQSPGC